MTEVIGRNVIEPVLEDGFNQEFDPFRRNASQVGIHHGAGPDVEPPGDLEDGPKGAAFSRDAVVGRHQLVEAAGRLVDENGIEVDLRRLDDVPRPIRGPSVGVNEQGPESGEVFGQASLHRLDNVDDGLGIIVAGNTDENVDLF